MKLACICYEQYVISIKTINYKKVIDLEEMVKTQKIKMIKRFSSEDEMLWKPTMKALLDKTKLNLCSCLKSNFSVPKTTPTSSRESLKFWKEIKYESTDSKSYKTIPNIKIHLKDTRSRFS